MTRWQFCLAAALFLPAAGRAHFIWLVPAQPAGPEVRVLFSDNLEPDQILRRRMERLGGTEFWVCDAAGRVSPLTLRGGDDRSGALNVAGEGFRVVGGRSRWGVHVLRERGETTPFLIYYYPKLILGEAKAAGGDRGWDLLTAEIVARREKDGLYFRVLYKGRPAPKAELRVLPPGEKKPVGYRTDDGGECKVPLKGAGTYAVWTMAGMEPTPGEHEGQKYDEVRHYATLVLTVGEGQAGLAK